MSSSGEDSWPWLLFSGSGSELVWADADNRSAINLSYPDTDNKSHEDSIGGNNESSVLGLTPVPLHFTQMTQNAVICVIAYSFIFIVAASGNFSVFFSVLQHLRRTKSRISILILHLSIADLLVTFGVIPLEIVWRITIQWYGGNVLCKVCKLFHAFGLYLSSTVLICISLDRYFAIIHPLQFGRRRGRIMLAGAWIAAAFCAAPQSLIFAVEQHPDFPSVHQCVSILYHYSRNVELIYNVFSVSVMYFLPLIIIVFTYGMILCKISRKSRQHDESRNDLGEASGRILLRRSDASNRMERAKSRTLRLTFVIVVVFVLCWTPYVVITLWYMLDRKSAEKVDGRVQDALFIMAVANSCVNPLVYGSFTKECRRSMTNCCGHSNCAGEEPPENHKINYSASRRSTSKASFRTANYNYTPPHTPLKRTPSPTPLNNKDANHLDAPPSPGNANVTLDPARPRIRSIKFQVPPTNIVNNQLVVENPLLEMQDFYSKPKPTAPRKSNLSINRYYCPHQKPEEAELELDADHPI